MLLRSGGKSEKSKKGEDIFGHQNGTKALKIRENQIVRKKKKLRRGSGTGKVFMVLGLFLLFLSLSLTIYNIYDEYQAGKASDYVLAELEKRDASASGQISGIGDEAEASAEAISYGDADGAGDFVRDGSEGNRGRENGAEKSTPGELQGDGTDLTGGSVPDYVLNPQLPMPETVIDGNAYIGKLELPELGIKLPVMSDWSYPKLKKAPCRYQGSAYTGDLIIAGHNYKRHFNGLKRMKTGSRVIFTDEAGNVFRYSVAKIERLDGYAVEQMEAGDWDLTLFTCTAGGSVRLTLRCKQI